ncbi:hypothetical protein AHGSH82_007220 [Aeromonas hydrophila]|nr:hypothetical protein AHGSH82_007220 [Aeromonas hydrophila]
MQAPTQASRILLNIISTVLAQNHLINLWLKVNRLATTLPILEMTYMRETIIGMET